MHINGIIFQENFIEAPEKLFAHLLATVRWDERMVARKTASFGVAYNYSQISYPYQAIPTVLQSIAEQIALTVGFLPNNCLINYYADGKAKMGFHADQTDILYENTGIVIISLGETRVLRFKNIAEPTLIHDYALPQGSLLYMSQAVQSAWLHAIPPTNTDKGRMSLTFRKIVEKAD
jgi:alkylated DNA repair dioxygenase AlkB